jgi:NTE family protein
VFAFLSKRADGGDLGVAAPGASADGGHSDAQVPRTPVPHSPLGGDAAAGLDAHPVATGGTRPSIGLALGGGAARGFAHIGILRTLLANGIKPDVIAGTSIGALVGGLYAAGHLEELEDWARSLTRRRIFGYLDFSFAGSGLIGGHRLAERLRGTLGTMRFEDLPIHVAAIATEIGTGHEIWLTRGRLAEALHASYALPGIFSPVQIGGRWLMDGALVNPVPVVIGINLNADLSGRGTTIASFGADPAEPVAPPPPSARSFRAMFGIEQSLKRQFFGSPGRPGFSTVMMEAFNIMQDRITRARLAGDPADVMINPRLGRVGLIDFDHAAQAIALGAEAAERALESIDEVIAAFR